MAQADAANVSKLNSYAVIEGNSAQVSKENLYVVLEDKTPSGDLSAALGSITASGVGHAIVGGSLSGALGVITLSSNNHVSAPIEGSAGASIGAIGEASSGSVTSRGSSSVSLGAITSSSSGTVITAPSDPCFNNVVLLMHADDLKDKISGNDATSSGGLTTINKSTVKFGSGSIKTSTDALYFPSSSNWDFGTGPFTIEFWVNFTGTSGARALISHYAVGGTPPHFEFYLQSGALRLYLSTGSGSFYSNSTSGVTFSAGTWYAVCLERDTSNILRIYVNGVRRSLTTGYNGSFSSFSPSSNLIIGSLRTGVTTWDSLAYFDEIRITKGIARYASDSGYDVQTEAFPDKQMPAALGSLGKSLDPFTVTATTAPIIMGALSKSLNGLSISSRARLMDHASVSEPLGAISASGTASVSARRRTGAAALFIGA